MQRQSVISSNVKSIGYDERTSILEVEFNDYSIYQYHGVPKILFESLINASSKGSFLHQYIKGRYPHQKIR